MRSVDRRLSPYIHICLYSTLKIGPIFIFKSAVLVVSQKRSPQEVKLPSREDYLVKGEFHSGRVPVKNVEEFNFVLIFINKM